MQQDDEGAPGVVPAAFEMPIRVTDAHVDGPGHHVNNIVYLKWAQEVAVAHWFSATTPEQQEAYTWVVQRHEIDYLRPAFVGDELIARTHVGKVSGARFDRVVEIRRADNGQVLARSVTTWAALDGRTGRPRRIGADLLARFHEPAR